MKKTQKKRIEELDYSSIDCTFTPYDWGVEYIQEWSTVFPDTSTMSVQQCVLLLTMRDEIESVRSRLSEEANTDLWRYEVVQSDLEHAEDFQPFINGYYDIPTTPGCLSPAVMQKKLRDLPVAVVKVGSQVKLAITQERIDPPMMLCWAYVLIGFLPPMSTVELHGCYGRIDSFILKACQRTIELVTLRCAMKQQLLDNILKGNINDPVNKLLSL